MHLSILIHSDRWWISDMTTEVALLTFYMFRDNYSGLQTGFLGLKARLTQAWLAPPLMVLVIYIVKLQLLKKTMQAVLDLSLLTVKAECAAAKTAVREILQMRQESITLVNTMINSAIKSTVDGAIDSLRLTMTIAEKLILFALEMTIGTYACLSLAAIDIAVGEALNATETIVNYTDSHIKEIGDDINSGLNNLSETINSAVGLLSSVESFITGSEKELGSVNLTVSKLKNLSLPTSINENLERIKNEVPTYDSTKTEVAKLISKPFAMVFGKLNSTKLTSNLTLKQNYGNEFSFPGCNITIITSEFYTVERDVGDLVNTICGLCGIGLAAGILFHLWSTKRRWQFLQATASDEMLQRQVGTDQWRRDMVNMDRITLAESNWFGRFAYKHFDRQNRWLVEYITRPPLMTFLLIGLAGILLSGLELTVLNILTAGSKTVIKVANATAQNVSAELASIAQDWVMDSNTQIASMEHNVNYNVLGVVHNGSQELNNTLNVFMNSIDDELVDYFNNTFLLQPLQATVQCLVGNKIDSVESGLTWIRNKSQVSLPRVSKSMLPNSTLVNLSGDTGSTKQAFESILDSGISSIRHQIVTQFVVSALFVGVWVFFAVGTLVYWFSAAHSHSLKESARICKINSAPPLSKTDRKDPQKYRLSLRPTADGYEFAYISNPLKSPIQRFSARVTRIFTGPDRTPSFDVVRATHIPFRGSIHDPESPRTPLKAMLHKNLYLD